MFYAQQSNRDKENGLAIVRLNLSLFKKQSQTTYEMRFRFSLISRCDIFSGLDCLLFYHSKKNSEKKKAISPRGKTKISSILTNAHQLQIAQRTQESLNVHTVMTRTEYGLICAFPRSHHR
jgi:hypothetical protein